MPLVWVSDSSLNYDIEFSRNYGRIRRCFFGETKKLVSQSKNLNEVFKSGNVVSGQLL